MKWRLLLAIAYGAAAASAQEIRVFSEFAKLDASGNPVGSETPREILSPAIARNAFTSFQVVIQEPPGTRTILHIGQNPENAVQVTMYRREGDRLQPITLPYESTGTQILWMDVWVAKDAPVRRIKLEPQVYIREDWVLYPMEVRVRDVQVPDGAANDTSVLDPFSAMQAFLCGAPLAKPATEALTVRRVQYRNALQDVALARQALPSDREELKKRLGGCKPGPLPSDPEFYLKVRDYFFLPTWMKLRGN